MLIELILRTVLVAVTQCLYTIYLHALILQTNHLLLPINELFIIPLILLLVIRNLIADQTKNL